MNGAIMPIWYERNEKGELQSVKQVDPKARELAGIGMGCCIIHRDVLTAMKERYDGDGWTWFAHDMGRLEGVELPLGEDFSFCNRAAACGLKIWGDGGIVAGHIKKQVLDASTFANAIKLTQLAAALDKD